MSTADESSQGDLAELAFLKEAEAALRDLFERAKAKSEVQFAMSLAPEFRGAQDDGWCTADEVDRAIPQYLEFISDLKHYKDFRARVALSFYCHLSEASGFYEIPKNMLRLASGEDYNTRPFAHLAKHRADRGTTISPNANAIFKDLLGHASELNLTSLANAFRDAFDTRIRHAYAHADYVIWTDGLRVRNKNGGHPFKISWEEFERKLNRAIHFYYLLRDVRNEYVSSYKEPKIVLGRINNKDLETKWRIALEADGSFSLSTGSC